jgi:hypothetical protein
MPDSITITNSFAQDIKLALDDALSCINVHETDERFDPQKAIGGIVRVRAELVNVLAQNSTCTKQTCDKIKLKRKLKGAIALAYEVLNGLDEAA